MNTLHARVYMTTSETGLTGSPTSGITFRNAGGRASAREADLADTRPPAVLFDAAAEGFGPVDMWRPGCKVTDGRCRSLTRDLPSARPPERPRRCCSSAADRFPRLRTRRLRPGFHESAAG